ncbi:MAG: hypothetical protein ACUVX9_13510 [Anaerolineae bacterium]
MRHGLPNRFCALILAVSCFCCACRPAEVTPEQREETSLRQLVLDWVVLDHWPAGIEQSFPDSQMLSRYTTLIVQDDGSAANAKLKIPGRSVLILDLDDIRKRADSEGDYIYLRFERVEIQQDKATVRLSMMWALSRSTLGSGRSPLGCAGAEVRFARDGAGWRAERILSTWRP